MTNQTGNAGSEHTDNWQRGTQEPWADARIQESLSDSVRCSSFQLMEPPKPAFSWVSDHEELRPPAETDSTSEGKRDKIWVKNISIQLLSLYSLQLESTSLLLGFHGILLSTTTCFLTVYLVLAYTSVEHRHLGSRWPVLLIFAQ